MAEDGARLSRLILNASLLIAACVDGPMPRGRKQQQQQQQQLTARR